MQLHLIRFDLFLPLLVSLMIVEALEELSPVSTLTAKPIAMSFERVSSSWARNAESSDGFHPEFVLKSAEIERSMPHFDKKIGGPWRRHAVGNRKVSKMTYPSANYSTAKLAEKMADEALGSREMQNTIKELSSLKGHLKQHVQETLEEPQNEMEKISQSTKSTTHSPPKTTVKNKAMHKKHRSHASRKHKGHRKPNRKHHRPKHHSARHYSMKESSKSGRERENRKSVSRGRERELKRMRRSEKSVVPRSKRNHRAFRMEKKRHGELKGNLTKKSLRPHSIHGNYREARISRKNTGKSHVARRKGLIAQLMRTTTRDPTKKNPGDQGVEYSEYYSDNDILLPEIREPLKLSENAKNLRERMRSIQDTEGDDFLDQNYYDLSDDSEAPQVSIERSKRNDPKTVEVMEAPANFMEYVDSSYRPVQIHGIGENNGIPKYIANHNYIPGRRVNVAYNPIGDPSVEVVAPRPVMNNEFFPANVRYGNSQIVKNPAPMLNMNPSMNVPIPPIKQFYPEKSRPPYYSVGDLPPANSLGFSISTSLGKPLNGTGPMDFIIPENEKLSKFGDASSVAIRDPFQDKNGAFGAATPASRGSSAALEISKNYFATFKATPSLIDSASRLLNSGVRDIKLNLKAPEVEYSNHRGPDQMEAVTSHENNPRGSGAVKKLKRKESDSTKTVEETSSEATESSSSKKQADETSSPATESSSVKSQVEQASSSTTESNSIKNRTVCNTTRSADHNSLATTSSQALVNVSSSVSGPVNSTISGSSTVSANITVSENTTIAGNQTKAVASQILSEIMGELEELRWENPKDEQKEGLPCKLTGSWVTTKAGVRIDMKVTNHSINVSLDYLTPPITTEGLLNVTWNATGFAPFKRGGPFTLIATNNHTKTLAVFVGACKVCQGIDTIEGTWTVSREPRDCRDFQMSTNIFNEIFRRTRLYSAIKDKQLKQLDEKTSSTVMTPVTNSSSSESSSTTHEGLMTSEKSHNETLRLNGTFK